MDMREEWPIEWRDFCFIDGELYDAEQRQYYHPGTLRSIYWLKRQIESQQLIINQLKSRLQLVTSANDSFFLEMETCVPHHTSHMIDLVTRPKY